MLAFNTLILGDAFPFGYSELRLNKLCEGGLLRVEQHGRHRYYHLANAEVAHVLETLLSLANHELIENEETLEPMYYARTCYDHIAGHLGVALVDALQAKKWIAPQAKDFVTTPKGETAFLDFGIDLNSLRKKRRLFARQCLDWTERKYHMSGALGAALTENLLMRKWLLKPEGGRVVHVSNAGVKGFRDVFGIKL